jgi:hypothetical protein
MFELRTVYRPPTPTFDAKIIATGLGNRYVVTHYNDDMTMEENHRFAVEQFCNQYNHIIPSPVATYIECEVSWVVK